MRRIRTAQRARQTLTSFESPNRPGLTIWGSVCVVGFCRTTTGAYTFWVAGDDQTQLLLSANDSPGKCHGDRQRAGLEQLTRIGTKYAQQKSVAITLQAGRYSTTSRPSWRKAGRRHRSAVAWELPGSGTGPGGNRGAIPRSFVGHAGSSPGCRQITFASAGGSEPGHAARGPLPRDEPVFNLGNWRGWCSGEVEDYAVLRSMPLSASATWCGMTRTMMV